MDNMEIYNRHRSVPKEATKPINAGRLKGMTDINPMFRIKSLTEDFGACGIGWYYTVDKQWVENCGNESVAFVNISLYIKVDGEWSQPIFGTGGSKIIAMESKGAYVSDEAFKMATTDAISVACKQLGYGADIYFSADRTKYTYNNDSDDSQQKSNKQNYQKQANSSAKTDAQVEQEAMATPDPRMLKTPDDIMTKEQYDYLVSEINRTGRLNDVLGYCKCDEQGLKKIPSHLCVSLLIGLIKSPSKGANNG